MEHMGVALGFGSKMLLGGAACLVHAFLPFLFTRTGSRTITELNDRMVANRVWTATIASRAGRSTTCKGR